MCQLFVVGAYSSLLSSSPGVVYSNSYKFCQTTTFPNHIKGIMPVFVSEEIPHLRRQSQMHYATLLRKDRAWAWARIQVPNDRVTVLCESQGHSSCSLPEEENRVMTFGRSHTWIAGEFLLTTCLSCFFFGILCWSHWVNCIRRVTEVNRRERERDRNQWTKELRCGWDTHISHFVKQASSWRWQYSRGGGGRGTKKQRNPDVDGTHTNHTASSWRQHSRLELPSRWGVHANPMGRMNRDFPKSGYDLWPMNEAWAENIILHSGP